VNHLPISETAGSILLADKPKPRAHFNEVHVQTLVSSTIVAQAVAAKIFKVDSPALFVRRISCKIMLGARRPFADSSDVLSDLNRQIVCMMRIPRTIRVYSAAFGKASRFTAKH
jgi:hypothetical protein